MNYTIETRKSHAITYLRGKDRFNQLTDEIKEQLIKENKEIFERINSILHIKLVDGQPYETAKDLINSVKKDKILLISRDFNNSKLLPNEENLRFRAVHDFFHIVTGAGFGYFGECIAYEAQKLQYSKNLRPIVFSEVVLQAAFCEHFGSFPNTQKVVIPEM